MSVLTWNGKVIDVEVPNSVVLKVVDTAGAEKGNTVSGGSKQATLETGAVINVPMFINVGEDILVDTRNDVYVATTPSLLRTHAALQRYLSRSGGASFN